MGSDPDGDEECQSIWYDKGGTGAEIAGRIYEPANARLIAKAPKMLVWLQEIGPYITALHDIMPYNVAEGLFNSHRALLRELREV